MCNTDRFWSIENHCKDSHKCWNWNNRNDEEVSTYCVSTKWTYQRKKVNWPQTRWGYSTALLSWENQIFSYSQKFSYHTIASYVKLTKVDKTPNTTLCTTPVTPPNTPSKPIICNILSERPLIDTEKANIKREFGKMWLLLIFMMK